MSTGPRILKIYRPKSKKTKNWYMRGNVLGIKVDKTCATHLKDVAKIVARKREDEIIQSGGVPTGWTFLDAAISYLEFGGEKRFLGEQDKTTGAWNLLIGHFQETPLDEIGQAEIDGAARHIYPGRKNSTLVRQVYGPMNAVLRHAAKRKKTDRPDLDKPKIEQVEVEFATPEYVAALLEECGPRLRRLVIFLVYTGCRISEAVNLTWDDMHLNENLAIIPRTKNGDGRAVHLPPQVVAEIAAIPMEERLLHGRRVFQYQHRSSPDDPLKNAAKRAGLKYLSPHKLGRHTFATWMIQDNDLKTVQVAGGWRSISAASRYMHVTPAQAAQAANNLPDVTGAKKTELERNPTTVKGLKR